MLTNLGKTITIYNIPRFIKAIISHTFSKSGLEKLKFDGFNSIQIFFLCSVIDRELFQEQTSTSAPVFLKSTCVPHPITGIILS